MLDVDQSEWCQKQWPFENGKHLRTVCNTMLLNCLRNLHLKDFLLMRATTEVDWHLHLEQRSILEMRLGCSHLSRSMPTEEAFKCQLTLSISVSWQLQLSDTGKSKRLQCKETKRLKLRPTSVQSQHLAHSILTTSGHTPLISQLALASAGNALLSLHR